MRLLFLNPGGSALGGSERGLALLLRDLNSRGHQTFVILLTDGDAAESFASVGSEVIVRIARLDLAARHASPRSFALGCARSVPTLVSLASQIRNDARRLRADLIQSNGLRAHFLLPLLGRRRPLVLSLHDDTSGLPRAAQNIASLAADAVLANSHYTARQVSLRRSDVIYQAFEEAPLLDRWEARSLLGLPNDRPVAVLAAHLTPYKGHRVAIDAIDQIEPAKRPLLVLAGGPIYGETSFRYEQELRQLVVNRGLQRDVRLLGLVAPMNPIYASADVLIHPTVKPEAFGRVIVEAQLAGIPVIASDEGGPRELIIDGRSGLLVPPGDAGQLAKAITRVLSDPLLASTLVAEGRVSARRFSSATHADRVEAVYQRVLAR